MPDDKLLPHIRCFRYELHDPLFKHPLIWHFFTYCKMRARRIAGVAALYNVSVHLDPCEFIIGRRQASEDTGLTEQNTRTAIKTLVKFKYLEKSTSKSTSKFSVYKIITPDIYRVLNIEANQIPNQQVTSNQPASNQQVTTINKGNKEKNVKKKPKASNQRPEYSNDFQTFWGLYPNQRRTGKESAYTSFNTCLSSDYTAQEIISGAKAYAPEWKQMIAEGKANFIPLPTTWLNQHRFLDRALELSESDRVKQRLLERTNKIQEASNGL